MNQLHSVEHALQKQYILGTPFAAHLVDMLVIATILHHFRIIKVKLSVIDSRNSTSQCTLLQNIYHEPIFTSNLCLGNELYLANQPVPHNWSALSDLPNGQLEQIHIS